MNRLSSAAWRIVRNFGKARWTSPAPPDFYSSPPSGRLVSLHAHRRAGLRRRPARGAACGGRGAVSVGRLPLAPSPFARARALAPLPRDRPAQLGPAFFDVRVCDADLERLT